MKFENKEQTKLWEVSLRARNRAHQHIYLQESFCVKDASAEEVTMTSSHKISFSIVDILDPNKFNSKKVNELSIIKEKLLPAPNADRTTLESDSTAGGDSRLERTEAGRENASILLF